MLNADAAARTASPTQANHVCVVYHDVAEFHARGAAFLLDSVGASARPPRRSRACTPSSAGNTTTFRWYADADVGVAGETDRTNHATFEVTLPRMLPVQIGARVVVDARDLEFIDHRGLQP